tara:strand:- start:575 stop:934 length:360 start_codon:yes stop_codon:yes gene_type:complete
MHHLVQIIRFESARKLTKVPKNHPCSNLYGLAFKLEIHVEGDIHDSTGFVMDFNDIERKFMPIKKQVDHHYLNEIVGLENPTSEILIEWIWNKLKPDFQELSKLVLWENEVSRVEFSGN